MNNYENEENFIDLHLILKELFNYIWLILAVVFVFSMLGFAYTKLCKPLEYTTSTCLYVKNSEKNAAISNASVQDLDASKSLAETYMVILTNDAIMDVVAEKLGAICSEEEINTYFTTSINSSGNISIDPQSILHYMNLSTINETEIIEISATTPSPIISTEICRIVAETAPSVFTRVVGSGFVETINVAKVPTFPSGPNAVKNALFAGLFGFVLSAGLVVLKCALNRTINNSDDFRNKCNLPVLSEIPNYELSSNKKNKNLLQEYIPSLKRKNAQSRASMDTILTNKVKFSVTEAYNMLRTNLNFTLSTHESNIFVVSSPLSGDGKSTTSANISITIAQTKAKILLIDCDLRRPSQHKLFNVSNDKGLSSVLTGEPFEKNVHKNVYENLDLLTAGSMPPNPSELLGSTNMKNFLESIKDKYDYILLDTSPINIVTDALLLSKLCAGIVLVVRQNLSTYDELNKAIESIEFVKGSILGVVINSVEENGFKGKKYGYAYTSEPDYS